MKSITIYHNPKCSKSRETLKILEDNRINIVIVLYLETGLTKKIIKSLMLALKCPVRDLMRRGESEYKDNKLSNLALSEDYLIACLAKFPKILERPIVIKGDQGVIGRPPENVLKII